MTIAKWNGTAYDYSGDTRYILDNNALYGTNCPFTSSGGVNVVKMWAGGFSGTTINSYLLLHKVQLTGAINTYRRISIRYLRPKLQCGND